MSRQLQCSTMPSKRLVLKEKEAPLPVTTSLEPEFAEVERGLYREVLLLLNELRAPYAVSGAFALQHHTGIWRDTKDLDLFVTLPNLCTALQGLKAARSECGVVDPACLAKVHPGDFFAD